MGADSFDKNLIKPFLCLLHGALFSNSVLFGHVECCEDLSPEESSCDRLSFYHFDISRLLKHGASLLGSAGAEFELQDDKSGKIVPHIPIGQTRFNQSQYFNNYHAHPQLLTCHVDVDIFSHYIEYINKYINLS